MTTATATSRAREAILTAYNDHMGYTDASADEPAFEDNHSAPHDTFLNVADALREQRIAPHLSLSLLADSEGTVDAAQVGVTVSHPDRHDLPALELFIDYKHLTDDRQATGEDAVIGYATVILDTYDRAVAFCQAAGLTIGLQPRG